MQEKITIAVSPGFIERFKKGLNRPQIHEELRNNTAQIASLLSGYHWAEKGMVNAIEIDPESIRMDENGKGTFKVQYGINIHYGCSDVDIDLDKSMPITIQIDEKTNSALLTGEYIPEREPDSY